MEEKIRAEDIYGFACPVVWEISTSTPPTAGEVAASKEAYGGLQKYERETIINATKSKIKYLPRLLRMCVLMMQERRYRNHWAWRA